MCNAEVPLPDNIPPGSIITCPRCQRDVSDAIPCNEGATGEIEMTERAGVSTDSFTPSTVQDTTTIDVNDNHKDTVIVVVKGGNAVAPAPVYPVAMPASHPNIARTTTLAQLTNGSSAPSPLQRFTRYSIGPQSFSQRKINTSAEVSPLGALEECIAFKNGNCDLGDSCRLSHGNKEDLEKFVVSWENPFYNFYTTLHWYVFSVPALVTCPVSPFFICWLERQQFLLWISSPLWAPFMFVGGTVAMVLGVLCVISSFIPNV